MELKIYAIYDYKVDEFNNVFTVQHDAQAERLFVDAAADKETMIGRHHRFCLVRLGTVSTESGNCIRRAGTKDSGTAYYYHKSRCYLS